MLSQAPAKCNWFIVDDGRSDGWEEEKLMGGLYPFKPTHLEVILKLGSFLYTSRILCSEGVLYELDTNFKVVITCFSTNSAH